MDRRLTSLTAGMAIPYGGDRVTTVTAELASAFRPGDQLVVVQETGDLLHVRSDVAALVDQVVNAARRAFADLARCTDEQITAFYEAFARRLADDDAFEAIESANAADVASARDRGRSTTRLALSESMRSVMVDGLRSWAISPAGRRSVVERVEHEGWSVEQVRSPLGVVGFVFEGRPNVFADATGVLRTGNTVVFRIGSDALGTAEAIVHHALDPALAEAGLPAGAVGLVASPSRAAGWALFGHPGLSLAVARGSGEAVGQLGAVARQAGTAVSLHGTGGAWLVASPDTDDLTFGAAVLHSLDRKVCNTLNVCCIPHAAADRLVPVFLDALDAAGARRGAPARLHVVRGSEGALPAGWLDATIDVARPEGRRTEARTDVVEIAALATEWEWEDNPEVTLILVDGVDHAVALANEWSPRLVASLVSPHEHEHERFWDSIDSPFVGNGFTRWVDGQFALGRPELGLSNWEHGRLFARSAVLSGDSVFTVRTRARQTDPDLHR